MVIGILILGLFNNFFFLFFRLCNIQHGGYLWLVNWKCRINKTCWSVGNIQYWLLLGRTEEDQKKPVNMAAEWRLELRTSGIWSTMGLNIHHYLVSWKCDRYRAKDVYAGMLIMSREALLQLWFHFCASSQILLTSVYRRYIHKNFLSCPFISFCVAPVPAVYCRMPLLANHLSCHSSL